MEEIIISIGLVIFVNIVPIIYILFKITRCNKCGKLVWMKKAKPIIPEEYKNQMIEKGIWNKIRKKKRFLRAKFSSYDSETFCKRCGNRTTYSWGLFF